MALGAVVWFCKGSYLIRDEFGKWIILGVLPLIISAFLFNTEYCLLLNTDTPNECQNFN